MPRLAALALAALVAAASAFAPSGFAGARVAAPALAPRAAGATAVFGRGDKRTKKGKIYHATHGKCRPAFKNRTTPPDPYTTLRDWGERQDPPMSVTEVIKAKMADKFKVEVTLEQRLAALQTIK